MAASCGVDLTPFGGAGPCIECGANDVTNTYNEADGLSWLDCRICGARWRVTERSDSDG